MQLFPTQAISSSEHFNNKRNFLDIAGQTRYLYDISNVSRTKFIPNFLAITLAMELSTSSFASLLIAISENSSKVYSGTSSTKNLAKSGSIIFSQLLTVPKTHDLILNSSRRRCQNYQMTKVEKH
jgi:hypothetical protein